MKRWRVYNEHGKGCTSENATKVPRVADNMLAKGELRKCQCRTLIADRQN